MATIGDLAGFSAAPIVGAGALAGATWTLGANTASLAGYSLEETLHALAALGFRAVELLAYEGALRRSRKYLAASGVPS